MKIFSQNRLLVLFLLVAVLLTPAQKALAAQPISIGNSLDELNITNKTSIYIDYYDKINPKSILDKQNEFKPFSETDASGSISNASYWINVPLTNSSSSEKEFLLEIKKPHLSSVTLYREVAGKLIEEDTIGYSLPFDVREIKHKNLLFPIKLKADGEQDYFLKIKTETFFQAPIVLWDPISFSTNNYLSQTGYGIYYGIMIAMIIYNCFLFFSLREKTYLYYILFVIGFTIMQLIWDGYAFQFLWGDFPWWALRSNSFFIIFSSIFALQFTKHFLQLNIVAPLLNRLINWVVAVAVVSLLSPFIVAPSLATMISTVIATVFVGFIIAIAITVRATSREAIYFLAAWSLLVIGVIVNLLAAYKLVPLHAVILNGPKIGALAEVFILSLGLADKIKRINLEKEKESKKYYIQSLLHNSYKSMEEIEETPALIESGLKTLQDATNFPNGMFLERGQDGWNISAQEGQTIEANQLTVAEELMKKPQFLANIHNNPFGIQNDIHSLLSIPVKVAKKEGLFVVFDENQGKLQNFEAKIITDSFADQFPRILTKLENYQNLKVSAMFDHLTNLYNRKYFFEQITELFQITNSFHDQSSLFLIDIDHFKGVNDTYGHMVGDKAIVYVANIIHKVCHTSGIVGRYGGEEFIVFLPNTSQQQAFLLANRLVAAMQQEELQLENNISLPLTISVGFSTSKPGKSNLHQLILHADNALYVAKEQGRNRAVAYQENVRSQVY
ncbi:diguanylate cyclase [Niallia taxi]|uniref:diguanylate cyclase n=1 Tax=Niallia taxi TaxID=2499688 RepID=UPI00119DFCCB|nr:diguanylate cyclase [Niallia taxi]MDE5053130.1 sensor domain-containing diguanylate cyclase [Niallia taxi]